MIVFAEGNLKGKAVTVTINEPDSMSVVFGIQDEFLIYVGY